jgi:hypothetical protein
VKGFAVTLIAGITASMLTSIFVVKTFYLLWLNRTRGRPDAEHLKAPMLRILHGTKIDFIKSWRLAAVLTAGFIAAGLIALVLHGGSTGASSSPAAR